MGGEFLLELNTDRGKVWLSGMLHMFILCLSHSATYCTVNKLRAQAEAQRVDSRFKLFTIEVWILLVCQGDSLTFCFSSFFQTLMNALCEPITVVWALCVRTQWALSCVIPNTSASAASHRTPMATVLVRDCQCCSLMANRNTWSLN